MNLPRPGAKPLAMMADKIILNLTCLGIVTYFWLGESSSEISLDRV